MEFIPSICPGCCINCGLYIVRDEDGIRIDYRKSSSVNEGKLCRFGVELGDLYSQEPLKATVNGKEVDFNTAKKEALKRLKKTDPRSTGFLAMGNSTNEEIRAFKKLAGELGIQNIDCGLSKQILNVPEAARNYLTAGLPLREIEQAEKILLISFNPENYPLIIRRLLRAERNGAELLKVESGEPYEGRGAIIVSELAPTSDPASIRQIIEEADDTATILFMKPYANLNSAIRLGFYGFDLIEAIRSDEIKSLFLLDPPPGYEDMFHDLELLVVQSDHESEVTGMADITLPSPRFFERRGTVVNVEGDLLPVGGDSEAGVEIPSKIIFPENH